MMYWDLTKDMYKCLPLTRKILSGEEQLQFMYDSASIYNAVNVDMLSANYSFLKATGRIQPIVKNKKELSTAEVSDIIAHLQTEKNADNCPELLDKYVDNGDISSICCCCPLSPNYVNARKEIEFKLVSFIAFNGGPLELDDKTNIVLDYTADIKSMEPIPYGKTGTEFFSYPLLQKIALYMTENAFCCMDGATFWANFSGSLLATKEKKIYKKFDAMSLDYVRNYVLRLFEKTDIDYIKVCEEMKKPYCYSSPASCQNEEVEKTNDVVSSDVATVLNADNAITITEEKSVPDKIKPSDNVISEAVSDNSSSNNNTSDVLNSPSDSSSSDNLYLLASEPAEKNFKRKPVTTYSADCFLVMDSPTEGVKPAKVIEEPDEKSLVKELVVDDPVVDEPIEPAIEPSAIPPVEDQKSVIVEQLVEEQITENVNIEPVKEVQKECETVEELKDIASLTEGNPMIMEPLHFGPCVTKTESVEPNSALRGVEFGTTDGVCVPGCVSVVASADNIIIVGNRDTSTFLEFDRALTGRDIVPLEVISLNGQIGILFCLDVFYFARYDSDCYAKLHSLFISDSVIKVCVDLFNVYRYVYQYENTINNITSLVNRTSVIASKNGHALLLDILKNDLENDMSVVSILTRYETVYARQEEKLDEEKKDNVSLLNCIDGVNALSCDVKNYVLGADISLTESGYVYSNNLSSNGEKGIIFCMEGFQFSKNVEEKIKGTICRRLLCGRHMQNFNAKLVSMGQGYIYVYVPISGAYDFVDVFVRIVSSVLKKVGGGVPTYTCVPRFVFSN